jgi:hypothetical protein
MIHGLKLDYMSPDLTIYGIYSEIFVKNRNRDTRDRVQRATWRMLLNDLP